MWNTFKVITSSNNPTFKTLKSLEKTKLRKKQGLFIIEGLKFVKESLSERLLHPLEFVVISKDRLEQHSIKEILGICKEKEIKLFVFDPKLFKKLPVTKSSQGIIGIFKEKRLQKPLNFNSPILILDRIQDPTNIGSILRSAVATGCSGVFLTKGSADPYSQKATRASAGAVLKIPIIYTENPKDLKNFLKQKGYLLVCASPKEKVSLFELKLPLKTALIVGNEGSGVTQEWVTLSDLRFSIPIFGKVESLNVSAATCTILYFIRFFNQ